MNNPDAPAAEPQPETTAPPVPWPAAGTAAPVIFICTPVILPTNPPRPCPDLLTADEAVIYLRLDTIHTKHPAETLRYYRDKGWLRGTQVGKCVFYRRLELDAFLSRATEGNPR